MINQREAFNKVLEAIARIRLLDHVIIIGSWAEYLYETVYFPGYIANLRTMDIDLLIPNINKVPKVELITALEEHDFAVKQDTLTGTTKFFHIEGLLEVEFLVRELGRGKTEPYDVKPLGIRVEGLRFLDIVKDNVMDITYNGLALRVPTPQAYILHKLLIYPYRKEKREKDMRSVEQILETIVSSEEEKSKLSLIFNGLSRSEKNTILKVCKENAIEVFW
ncbi:MAG: hypothetical protein HPY50_17970 [Firmicutes bacterium]|nr:hypothetical protein [Bacillota bacterium]